MEMKMGPTSFIQGLNRDLFGGHFGTLKRLRKKPERMAAAKADPQVASVTAG
jgi:hypothetical protein